MTHNQDRHAYPNYSLTTAMYFAERIYQLVCWCERRYQAATRKGRAD